MPTLVKPGIAGGSLGSLHPEVGGPIGSISGSSSFVGSVNDGFIGTGDVVPGFTSGSNPVYLSDPAVVDDVETNVVPTSGTSVDNAKQGGFSLSEFMAANPGLSAEKIMEEASKHGDEFAEKYLDYLVERGELDRANAYTAEREDTAYQRLVEDLKAAGLNPAMMYGSSASTTTTGSQGYVKMVEGANSRSVSNYKKVKDVILGLLKFELSAALGVADSVFKGFSSIADVIDAIIPF